MNEADTRALLIDKHLEAAGWVTEGDVRVYREFRINAGAIQQGGERSPSLSADYVLEYRGKKLAAIEAKSDEVAVSEGVGQAKQYASKLRLPFAYAANGKAIYEISLSKGQEGDVLQFPSPDELWRRAKERVNEWQERFNAIPFEMFGGTHEPRYFQEIAVTRATDAIAKDQKRILLTLATGTGKTFVAFQIAWKLYQARWNINGDGKRRPRILFLADRNILANQAYLAFGGFSDDAKVRITPHEVGKRGHVPLNGSVFFTIFQTFVSGETQEEYFTQYPSDFFDLVFIDECHRGGANDESSWREILDHFNTAVHIGLTATPKRTVNVDTYRYFGEPVFEYSLKEGIEDGFLTPFRVKRIQSTIDEYVYSSEDEVLAGEIRDGGVFEEKDFNTKIVMREREEFRVQQLLANIGKDEKSIVFCRNQEHAALVRDLINQKSPSTDPDYCARVTANDGVIGDNYLRRFQDNEKTIPTILTTSQKLSTGVDARNVRNVVLLRPVNNMIEFKQIIGRGTRLFEGKGYFTILDFVGAYALFEDDEWDGTPLEPPEKPERPSKPAEGPDEPTSTGGDGSEDDTEGDEKPEKIRIRLSDGKVREIQYTTATLFYLHGKPVSAAEYIKYLYDDVNLPTLLGSEDELRATWSNPVTRDELLRRLADAGCSRADLGVLQTLINAEDCDLFDVLEYIAYTKPTLKREQRAQHANTNIQGFLNSEQREFVSYVLRSYVKAGVDELSYQRLTPALNALYGNIREAQQRLGPVEEIKEVFEQAQEALYLAEVG